MSVIDLDKLHLEFKESTVRYHKTEADLLDHAEIAEREKLYLHRGFSSMYAYVTEELGLSESTACNVLNVSRVTRDYAPELREEIRKGNIGLAKSRKLCPVLQNKNQDKPETREEIKNWIEKAKTQNTRDLEAAVAEQSEAPRRRDSLKQTSKDNSRLSVDVSNEARKELERLVDVLSSQKQECLSLSQTIQFAIHETLERHDPLKKAERKKLRESKKEETKSSQNACPEEKVAGNSPVTGSRPTPAEKNCESSERIPLDMELKHDINLRDGGRCTYISPDGKRCNANRFLEFHHIKPVFEGGKNEISNLTTLCSAHHKLIHNNKSS